MGGPAVAAEEQEIIRAYLAQGVPVEEICEGRHHSQSTVFSIENGTCTVAAPRQWHPRTRQPDPPGPDITEAQQRAVSRAAEETPRGPGRYRQIAAAAGVDLDTAYLLLLGRHPGPIAKVGDEADRDLFYAEVGQEPTQTPQIAGYDIRIDNPAAEVKTAGEGPGKGVTRT